MDTKARDIIERTLTDYASVPYAYGDIQTLPIFDRERDHYLLVNVGRFDRRRVHGCLIHISIEGDTIVVQRDGTEHGVARDLVTAGIAAERILLAGHPGGPVRYVDALAAA
jgi:hypothetical protein